MLRGVATADPGAAAQIAEAVRSGTLTAAAVTEAALARARSVQAELNAFVTVAEAAARERAAALDAGGPEGRALPLAGVPVVVKDNICTEGVRTTAGSLILDGFVPPYSATVVERLGRAGAVMIAKANLDEFGMGSTNENSAYGPVLNPHARERVAGGSSGGSAAAVAAGVAPIALGSDTGGSVRLPASFCGVVGFKPTYGALSRYGLVAYASSLDQIGILARSVRDIQLTFGVLLGADPLDATSFDLGLAGPAAVPGVGADRADLAGVRIGVIRELAGEGMSMGVLTALKATQARLEGLGAEVVPISLASVRYAVPAYYVIATAEASSNLARYDGMLYGGRVGHDAQGHEAVMTASRGRLFGREVKRRVLMGSFALSAGYYDAYYGCALKVRRLLANEMAAALSGVDALLSPTAPSIAYRLGEKLADPVAMYVGDIATCLANLAGVPAVSVPAGTAEEGMPVGVQLMTRARGDHLCLRLAGALEAS